MEFIDIYILSVTISVMLESDCWKWIASIKVYMCFVLQVL